jgi:hypothetical protein
MPVIKGVNIIALKKLVKERGELFETTYLDKLSPKGRELYDSVIATTWVKSEDETELMVTGAKQLFPGDPKPMVQLGRALANQNMTGIYKIFLKIPTIPFIIKRVANIWSSFYQEGKAEVISVQDHSLTMQVTELPDIEDYQTDITCGYILELLDITGSKNASVNYDGSDPKAFKWHISWQ